MRTWPPASPIAQGPNLQAAIGICDEGAHATIQPIFVKNIFQLQQLRSSHQLLGAREAPPDYTTVSNQMMMMMMMLVVTMIMRMTTMTMMMMVVW